MSDTFTGTRSPESLKKLEEVQQTAATTAAREAVLEAAGNAEEVVRMISQMWSDLGFTPEQCVFALCLTTINYRETLPEKLGGKAMFDRVASEAQAYYDANK